MVVQAATAEGIGLSAWMTTAGRPSVQVRPGLPAVAEWKADNGPLIAQVLDTARRRAAVTADR
jgi:hypothetical protein